MNKAHYFTFNIEKNPHFVSLIAISKHHHHFIVVCLEVLLFISDVKDEATTSIKGERQIPWQPSYPPTLHAFLAAQPSSAALEPFHRLADLVLGISLQPSPS